MRPDRPGAHDLGLNVVRHGRHPKLDRAVGKQHPIAGSNVRREPGVGHTRTALIARRLVTRPQGEAITRAQRDRVAGQPSEPDLGSWQVHHHGRLARGVAQPSHRLGMLVGRPVREVDAGDVHAGRDELVQAADGGRTDGADELRAAAAHDAPTLSLYAAPAARRRSWAESTRLRRRMAEGVTSTSSSAAMNSIAASRVITRGGVKMR